jgi:hypothetical protein
MPDAPRWSVNEIAYLRESALIGFIEGYKITNIKWDPHYSRWLYEAAIKQRGTEPNSVIDMYNLRRQEVIELGENDLVNQSEALDLAIINTEQRLKQLKNKRAVL